MRYQIADRALADFRSQPYTGNPALIQGRFAADQGHGNFELLVPLAAAGLAGLFRENNAPGVPWETSAIFGQSAGRIDAVSMIQSNFGNPGNLEVVARVGETLQFFFRNSGPQFVWVGPFELQADNRPIRGVSGNPVLVQSGTDTRAISNCSSRCPPAGSRISSATTTRRGSYGMVRRPSYRQKGISRRCQ